MSKFWQILPAIVLILGTLEGNARLFPPPGRSLARGVKHMPYRKMRKVLKQAKDGVMVASIIDEIGQTTHGGSWKHSYYDNKFSMISNNLDIINEDIKGMGSYLHTLEGASQTSKTSTIIIGCVSITLIVGLIVVAIYLSIKTKSS